MHKNYDINNLEALLLDLDGTLINSEKAFCNSFQKILKNRFNIVITKEDYKKYELEQNAKLLVKLREKQLLPSTITDIEIMKQIYSDYQNEFEKVILEKEAIDNFELLKQLKKIELKLALVTTCRRHYLNILIKTLKLENLFDTIIAREDVINLKPAPDAYLMATQQLKLKNENCLAIEDSKRGVDASIAAGITTIKVENFTSIKYIDERTINEKSANDVLNKILVKRMNVCENIDYKPKF